MPNFRDQTITVLSRNMETFLAAKEFAQFKLFRLDQQNGLFPNPNLQKEHAEYASQVERCDYEISKILLCIEWLNNLKVINHSDQRAA